MFLRFLSFISSQMQKWCYVAVLPGHFCLNKLCWIDLAGHPNLQVTLNLFAYSKQIKKAPLELHQQFNV
jgi:hypothetical protein